MTDPADDAPVALRLARVLDVAEDRCGVWTGEQVVDAAFAPTFPTPRTERVSPGHLVALASRGDSREVVIWRWYDAVVLSAADDGEARLWEPAHGVVVAQRRPGAELVDPGARAYASAGLPGADWWVVGAAHGVPRAGDIDLAEVEALYTDNDLWEAALGPQEALDV